MTGPRADTVSRFTRWMLNAPPGYRWTDDEVGYEKKQSFMTGVIVGTILTAFILAVVVAL